MPSEREREQSAGRHSSGLTGIWHHIGRRFGGLSGKRDLDQDKWTWFGDEQRPARNRRRLFLFTAEAAAGIAIVLGGTLFIVLRTGDADETTIGSSPTPGEGSALVRLAIWDSPSATWETDDVTIEGAQRNRGLAVPFLLHLENASPGEVYRIDLTYECGGGGTSGLEFLTDFDRDAGSLPALTAPGPERSFPDASAVILDDPSISGDDQSGGRLFWLWGATFVGLPVGPAPSVPCDGEKSFSVSIRSRDETVHMLWGAQLAAETDAPEPARSAAFRMQVVVQGIQEPAEISVVVLG